MTSSQTQRHENDSAGLILRSSQAPTALVSPIDELLSNPLNVELLGIIEKFSKSLRHSGFRVGTYSPRSLARLAVTSDEAKKAILENFQLFTQWILPSNTPPLAKFDRDVEISFVRKVLAHYKLNADESFIDSIEDGDIIEIYSADMHQLYRSMNFFNYTNYTLLDISLFEWFVLWERPKRIIEMMIDDSSEVTSKCLPLFKFRVPRHLLKETFNSNDVAEFVPSASIIEFKFMGALTHQERPANTAALICTSRGEVVAEGQDALSIGLV